MPAEKANLQPRDKGITGNKQTPPKPGQAMALRQTVENQIAYAQIQQAQEPTFSPEDFSENRAIDVAQNRAIDTPQPSTVEPTPEHSISIGQAPIVLNVDTKGGVVSSEQTAMLQAPIPEQNKPPSSMAEFRQQQKQQFNPSSYPEISDIFTGKAGPMWNPQTGVIDVRAAQEAAMPPKPQPLPPQEIIVKHELPDQAMAYKVIRGASAYLGSVMQTFFEGQIIYEISTIDQLLSSGCDWIVPVETAENFICCPACRHQFPAQMAFQAKQQPNYGMVAAMFPHNRG